MFFYLKSKNCYQTLNIDLVGRLTILVQYFPKTREDKSSYPVTSLDNISNSYMNLSLATQSMLFNVRVCRVIE